MVHDMDAEEIAAGLSDRSVGERVEFCGVGTAYLYTVRCVRVRFMLWYSNQRRLQRSLGMSLSRPDISYVEPELPLFDRTVTSTNRG